MKTNKQILLQVTDEVYEKIKRLKLEGLPLTKSIIILLISESNKKQTS